MRNTAYSYDAREREHDWPGHPENRQRLAGTRHRLAQDGLLDALPLVAATPISDDRLQRAHTAQHIARVEAFAGRGGGHLDPDTYVTPASAVAARVAAGGLTNLMLAVMDGAYDNGMALVRPPGHHASASVAEGFCLYNNVAVAARTAQAERGIERILIVDFDVHHGNGTEAIFYDDPGVLFFSTHQYPYYPGTGAILDTGRGAGQGFTANVPLPAGVGDAGYTAVYEQILWPLARRYRPQLILVSAGFDAHWDDPLAGELLSLAGYAHLVRELIAMATELCDGRLVLVLEGGYNLDVLQVAVANTLHLLRDLAAETADPFGPALRREREIDGLLRRVREVHGL
jgi:acetoin utilization deacetylase AcuC-like enzyme